LAVKSVRLALLRYSASARAEVSAPCGWRSAPATHVAVHCANPRSEPFRRSLHRCTEAITSFRCGSVDDETKPELLLGEAPSSLSIDLSLAHGPLELLSSIQSHATSLPALTTSLIINCVSERPNCTGTFQCRSMNEHATPRSLSSEESGRGSRRSGCLVVVVVSLFALLGRCVVRRSTGRRLFFVFRSRVTSPRASRSSARSVRWAVLLCRPAIAGIPLR